MSYDDLQEARTTRIKKDADKEAKGKIKRRGKRKGAALGSQKPKTRVSKTSKPQTVQDEQAGNGERMPESRTVPAGRMY